jgi:nitrite reductase/ring-hydroxylating ferredoxin subunit
MATFDLKTGCVLAGPTEKNLQLYKLKIDGAGIHVSLADGTSTQDQAG